MIGILFSGNYLDHFTNLIPDDNDEKPIKKKENIKIERGEGEGKKDKGKKKKRNKSSLLIFLFTI